METYITIGFVSLPIVADFKLFYDPKTWTIKMMIEKLLDQLYDQEKCLVRKIDYVYPSQFEIKFDTKFMSIASKTNELISHALELHGETIQTRIMYIYKGPKGEQLTSPKTANSTTLVEHMKLVDPQLKEEFNEENAYKRYAFYANGIPIANPNITKICNIDSKNSALDIKVFHKIPLEVTQCGTLLKSFKVDDMADYLDENMTVKNIAAIIHRGNPNALTKVVFFVDKKLKDDACLKDLQLSNKSIEQGIKLEFDLIPNKVFAFRFDATIEQLSLIHI